MAGLVKRVFAVISVAIILAIFYASTLIVVKKDAVQLVKESACKIPILDPWDKTILAAVEKKPLPWCKWTPHLTYIQGPWLKFNQTLVKQNYNISKCEYQIIPYHNEKQDDRPIQIVIKLGVRVTHDFIRVSCYGNDEKKSLVYRNYHILATSRKPTQNTVKKTKEHKNKPWNVMMVATDSMSHSAGIRYFPETHKFMKNHLNATEMLGYTKVGLNTFPNMIALLTGKHLEEETTLPHKGPFDDYPLVFKNFSAAGYKTMFADEAGPYGALFYYTRRGVNKAPTDYYFRPIGVALREEQNISYKGCEKLLVHYRLLLDYMSKFTDRYHKKEPYFAFTYNYMLSHDFQYYSRHLDQLYYEFLTSLDKKGIFDDTILFFFGDHGARWGMIMNTEVGVLEGKLPMMWVVLPRKFRQKYPNFVSTLKGNDRALTTVFDVRQTLLDIIALGNDERQMRSGHGISFLTEVPKERTCADAAIPLHFCACYREEKISTKKPLVRQGALFLVNEVNNILKDASKLCEKLELHNISSAIAFNAEDDFRAYRVIFTTKPGFGKFEGTLMFRQKPKDDKKDRSTWKPVFSREGPISRHNAYGKQSACVNNAVQQIYCYCKHQIKSK